MCVESFENNNSIDEKMSYHYQPQQQQGIFQFNDNDTISDLSNSQDQSYSIRETNNPLSDIINNNNNNNNNNNFLLSQQQQQQLNNNTTIDLPQIQLDDYWKSIDQIIDLIPIGTFHSRILWICGVAFMADGMELSLLAFIATCASSDLNFTDRQAAFLISLVFLGEFLGSITFGFLADKFGRLKSFLFACFLISLAGIVSGYSDTYKSLVISRMVVGFGVGGLSVPFDLVSEFSPNKSRGSLLVYLRCANCIGAVYIAAIALLFRSSVDWRVMTFMATLPVIIAIPFAVIFIPESPIWLLEQKRTIDAEKSLRYVAFVNGTSLPHFRLMFNGKDTILQSTLHFFSFDLLKVTIPLLLLWIFFGFSYYGLVIFIGRVFERGDVTGENCSYRSLPIFWSAIAELLGLFIGYLIIDKLGRITTQSSLYAGAAVSVFMLSLDLPLLALAVVAIFARGTITSAIAATWTLTPELYPTKLRSTSHSIANSMSRLGAFFVPYVIHNTTNHIPSIGTGLILCIVNVLAVITVLFLPETMGKTLSLERFSRTQRAIDRANAKTVHAVDEESSESSRSSTTYDENQNIQSTPTRNLLYSPRPHYTYEEYDEKDDEQNLRPNRLSYKFNDNNNNNRSPHSKPSPNQSNHNHTNSNQYEEYGDNNNNDEDDDSTTINFNDNIHSNNNNNNNNNNTNNSNNQTNKVKRKPFQIITTQNNILEHKYNSDEEKDN